MGYKPQYNNNGNYQKRSYTSNSGSNGGTAEMTSTKKDGVILKVILNNQNLVFIISDLIMGLILFESLKIFKSPQYIYFSILIFFPFVIGMQNIYR